METRIEKFQALFPQAPAYRMKQLEQALFSDRFERWGDVSSLPPTMRETLETQLPWMTLAEHVLLTSVKKDTYKAALKTQDGKLLESVLMQNARRHWTICVSSQIGCAMNCSFCATGKMGFTRNLTNDEILDQYRYWQQFLHTHPAVPEQITNIVFMGMGEPMTNYDAVKTMINTLLKHTDIGPTHITVSSVGILPQLEKLIDDPEWPPVRIAISLHSADSATRQSIVPTSYDDFLDRLAVWAKRYLEAHGNRRRHLTFEHIMLDNVNDTPEHAKKLAAFARRIGTEQVRINLIPYNTTQGNAFAKSAREKVENFQRILTDAHVTATIRRTMGDDIAAACGQLVVEKEK